MLNRKNRQQQYVTESRRGPRVEVVFGSPRRDCRGMGICKMEHQRREEGALRDCPRGAVHLQLDSSGRLLLHFDRTSMSRAVYARYFAAGTFTLDTSFDLPGPVVLNLGLPMGQYEIEAGAYPVLEIQDQALVSVRVRPVGQAGRRRLLRRAA